MTGPAVLSGTVVFVVGCEDACRNVPIVRPTLGRGKERVLLGVENRSKHLGGRHDEGLRSARHCLAGGMVVGAARTGKIEFRYRAYSVEVRRLWCTMLFGFESQTIQMGDKSAEPAITRNASPDRGLGVAGWDRARFNAFLWKIQGRRRLDQVLPSSVMFPRRRAKWEGGSSGSVT